MTISNMVRKVVYGALAASVLAGIPGCQTQRFSQPTGISQDVKIIYEGLGGRKLGETLEDYEKRLNSVASRIGYLNWGVEDLLSSDTNNCDAVEAISGFVKEK